MQQSVTSVTARAKHGPRPSVPRIMLIVRRVKAMKSILLLSMIVVLSGCSLFDAEDDAYNYSYAAVESVEVLSIEEGRVVFLCHAAVPTPCHEYGSKTVRHEGSKVFVRLSSRIRQDRRCIFMLSSLDERIEIGVASGQTYTFRFDAWDDTVDLAVQVPQVMNRPTHAVEGRCRHAAYGATGASARRGGGRGRS